MATQSNPVGSACRASATATSTPRILSHVTPGPASASSACTTLMVRPVPTVNRVTMATLWPMTADVSDDSRLKCICIDVLLFSFVTSNNTQILLSCPHVSCKFPLSKLHLGCLGYEQLWEKCEWCTTNLFLSIICVHKQSVFLQRHSFCLHVCQWNTEESLTVFCVCVFRLYLCDGWHHPVCLQWWTVWLWQADRSLPL